jgi:hypothetical protein
MKRLLALGAALLLVGAFVMPASADVFVFGQIDKFKTIDVFVDVTIDKDVDLNVTVDVEVDKASESLALANQVNENLQSCENCAEKRAQIIDSILTQTGITTVNQGTGNNLNQGNLLAVGLDVPQPGDGGTPGQGTPGFANSEVSAEQRNTDNHIDSVNILFRESRISGSINGNTGITAVNQAAGQMMNQLNATAIAFAFEGSVALAEADLGQSVTGRGLVQPGECCEEPIGERCDYTVYERYAVKNANIEGSINNNFGVTHVNQASGNNGNQSNMLSLATSNL